MNGLRALGASRAEKTAKEASALRQVPWYLRGGAKLFCHLELGAAEEAKQNDAWTALMPAAQKGHVPVVERLIALGAAVGAQNANGWTAVMIAAENGQLEVVERLILLGAAVADAKGANRCTALRITTENGHCKVAQGLIACGEEVATCTSDGAIPNEIDAAALVSIARKVRAARFKAS